jgi:hypothetical protein
MLFGNAVPLQRDGGFAPSRNLYLLRTADRRTTIQFHFPGYLPCDFTAFY